MAYAIRSTSWTSISGFAASCAASSRASCRPPGSAACSAPFRPGPSPGSSPMSSNPTRCAACASTFPTPSWSRCTQPTWPTSSRNSAPPSARPSSKPSTAKPPPTPFPKSKIPKCRPASWNPWNPRRLPISWRKWRPTRPPISSTNWRRKPAKRFRSEVEDPKMQASILESLEPEKAADIMEEMAPDEAADILNELEEETSEEILDEMDSAPETEVRELLEFEEDTAGGMMNTEYVSLHENASVMDALAALRGNEDLLEGLNTLFLVDAEERLSASIPLARLFIASANAKLKDLASETLIQVSVDERQDRVTELFDKYNLLTLPVVDDEGKLAGAITADDIISLLRQR